jgi:hypothetical protein
MSAAIQRLAATWRFAPAPGFSVTITFSADGHMVSELEDGDLRDHKEGTFVIASQDGDVFTIDGTMDGNTQRATITLGDGDTRAYFEGLGPQPFEMTRA